MSRAFKCDCCGELYDTIAHQFKIEIDCYRQEKYFAGEVCDDCHRKMKVALAPFHGSLAMLARREEEEDD